MKILGKLPVLVLLVLAAPARASESWFQSLEKLKRDGFILDMSYSFDYIDNLSGGARQDSTYQDNFLAGFGILGDKFDADGATVYFNVLGNNGHNPGPSVIVGDAQGVSNIEAPDKWQIHEAWYEQVFGKNFSVKAGYYDLNSEFDVISTASLFLNSSHGIGPDIAQSVPSLFPELQPGARLAYNWSQGYYLLAAYSKNENTMTDNNIVMIEYGKQADVGATLSRYGIGLWYYTHGVTTDLAGNTVAEKNNQGVYALYEKGITSKLHVFLRYGVAEDELNMFSSYLGLGAVYTGLFDGREKDRFGVAIARADNSSTYKAVTSTASSNETNIELSYRAQVTQFFSLQPDIQYVMDPGADTSLSNATVFTVRATIEF